MKFSSDSEWFAPIIMIGGGAVFFALVIGAIFLVRPPMQNLSSAQQPIYTFETTPLKFNIGTIRISVPKNYVRSADKNKIIFHALLPNFAGYRRDNWWLFEEKSPNSKMISIQVEHLPTMISQQTRFKFLVNHQLEKLPQSDVLGLAHYFYKKAPNRTDKDVFARIDNKNQLIYFCFRLNSLAISPNCSRTFAIAIDTAFTYRFKRSRLKNWREIEARIQKFIKQIHQLSFIKKKNTFANKI